ncbi:GNAT family protein [Winogradskyella sp.]|uniref:GNAT family N-acetyltransferase n=1 Tax=Winogradskyella sp. TaxID=1883156 RepID=UPI0025CC880F|nr:GNAT family protein [Winogradskyella sp.]
MMEFKPHSIDFAKEFSELKNVPEILDNGYDKTPNPYTEKDAIEFITKEIGKKPAERFLIYWNNEVAGEIGITIKEDVFRLNAEIGYFISKKFWRKGLATQAVKKMTDYTFKHFDVVRLVAGVFDFNKSSMKVLEKNDYYLESIRKNAVIKNGKIIDDYIWVKLRDTENLTE